MSMAIVIYIGEKEKVFESDEFVVVETEHSIEIRLPQGPDNKDTYLVARFFTANITGWSRYMSSQREH